MTTEAKQKCFLWKFVNDKYVLEREGVYFAISPDEIPVLIRTCLEMGNDRDYREWHATKAPAHPTNTPKPITQ